jgi:phosphoglycolate phosphatase
MIQPESDHPYIQKYIDSIIFDLDGTLLDTSAELMAGLQIATNQLVVESKRIAEPTSIFRDYPNLLGAPLREIYDELVKPNLPSPQDVGDGNDDEDATTFDRWVSLFVAGVDAEPPAEMFPDCAPPLIKLKQLIKSLGVATTKPSPVALGDLKNPIIPEGVFACFDWIQGTDAPLIRPKPCPDVVLACAKELKVEPSRTVYIGDTARDAQAAKAAGCAACLTVRRDGKDDTLKADGLIRGFEEILDVLEKVLKEKHGDEGVAVVK